MCAFGIIIGASVLYLRIIPMLAYVRGYDSARQPLHVSYSSFCTRPLPFSDIHKLSIALCGDAHLRIRRVRRPTRPLSPATTILWELEDAGSQPIATVTHISTVVSLITCSVMAISGYVVSIGVVSFAFAYHHNLLLIYVGPTRRTPTLSRFATVAHVSTVVP
jgi:hypothetical protein